MREAARLQTVPFWAMVDETFPGNGIRLSPIQRLLNARCQPSVVLTALESRPRPTGRTEPTDCLVVDGS